MKMHSVPTHPDNHVLNDDKSTQYVNTVLGTCCQPSVVLSCLTTFAGKLESLVVAGFINLCIVADVSPSLCMRRLGHPAH